PGHRRPLPRHGRIDREDRRRRYEGRQSHRGQGAVERRVDACRPWTRRYARLLRPRCAAFCLMALRATLPRTKSAALIEGKAVQLRAPAAGDYAEWAALRGESRDFLTPWEPTWAPDELSRAGFKRRLRRYSDAA